MPTVLHFRGTERVQSWPERVAQNARWLARISDPDELVVVRRELSRVRSEREAALMERLERVESERDGIVNGRWLRLRERLLPLRRALRGR